MEKALTLFTKPIQNSQNFLNPPPAVSSSVEYLINVPLSARWQHMSSSEAQNAKMRPPTRSCSDLAVPGPEYGLASAKPNLLAWSQKVLGSIVPGDAKARQRTAYDRRMNISSGVEGSAVCACNLEVVVEALLLSTPDESTAEQSFPREV